MKIKIRLSLTLLSIITRLFPAVVESAAIERMAFVTVTMFVIEIKKSSAQQSVPSTRKVNGYQLNADRAIMADSIPSGPGNHWFMSSNNMDSLRMMETIIPQLGSIIYDDSSEYIKMAFYSNPSFISTLDYSKLTSTPTIPTNTNQLTNGAGFLTTLSFTSLTGKPTTLSGYGITDGITTSRSISTTSPLTGGGDLSVNRTVAINNAAADNATKGAAVFDSVYFNDNGSGLITVAVNYGTGSVSVNAVTINQPRGKITYASPSISAGTATGVTFTNSYINATSIIGIWLNGNGSNLTAVNCYVKSQTSGSCVINISNLSLLNLFNTGFIIDYFVLN